jgi:addiction module RelE/StbE family toxin
MGKSKDFRECHIEPNWLLIYQVFTKLAAFFRVIQAWYSYASNAGTLVKS